MEDLAEILIEIQDKLVPLLDSYEQAIYHYLFRHTYLAGKEKTLFSTRTAEIGFGSGDRTKPPSWKTRSDRLKTLEQKGCVKIVERSNRGMLVEIILPSQMPFLQQVEVSASEINIEELDFYKDRRLLESILEREDFKCFYTGRKISIENCYLDHVTPQAKGGNNSYRNIVAACFDANSMKNDKDADDFIRLLYREELITLAEFNSLKNKLVALRGGELAPNIESLQRAIYS
jgi:5-methylcytosine-specific restriction endonuclease McrA